MLEMKASSLLLLSSRACPHDTTRKDMMIFKQEFLACSMRLTAAGDAAKMALGAHRIYEDRQQDLLLK